MSSNQHKTQYICDQIAGLRLVKCGLFHEAIDYDSHSGKPTRDPATDHSFKRNCMCPVEIRRDRLACAHTFARIHLNEWLTELGEQDPSVHEQVVEWKKMITSIDKRIRVIDRQKSDAEVKRAQIADESVEGDVSTRNAAEIESLIQQHNQCVQDLDQLRTQILDGINLHFKSEMVGN